MNEGCKALVLEAIEAHKAYVADKPWMSKPRPICVDVADLDALLAEIATKTDMLRRARNLLSHPTAWAKENAASRWKLSEEIARMVP